MTDYECIVYGGGIAGCWLFNQLCRNGAKVLLIDAVKLGRFASTRNQGWLHSGALYALRGSPGARETINQIQAGVASIRALEERFEKKLIYDKYPGLYIFDHPDSAQSKAHALRQFGLAVKPVEIKQVIEKAPFLENSPLLSSAIATEDFTINTHAIMQGLIDEGISFGGEVGFVSESEFIGMRFDEQGSVSVAVGGHVHTCEELVLTAGPATPTLLESNGLNHNRYSVKGATVFSLPGFKVDQMTSLQSVVVAGMNVSPYLGGASINLGDLDATLEGHDSRVSPIRSIRRLERIIEDYLPSLKDQLPFAARHYSCQKLEIVQSEHSANQYGSRSAIIDRLTDRVTFFYPGKFTSAEWGVKSLINMLRVRSSSTQDQIKGLVSLGSKEVAARQYYGPMNLVFFAENGRTRHLESPI
ncbi:MAG: FAD-dependent oxidoreductase [Pseudomonadota bacterium]